MGGATNCDAHHMTDPRADGKGVAGCIKMALRNSDLDPEAIQYINPHATSTLVGDVAEVKAMKQAFPNFKVPPTTYPRTHTYTYSLSHTKIDLNVKTHINTDTQTCTPKATLQISAFQIFMFARVISVLMEPCIDCLLLMCRLS
jgi:hypothetical protein